MTNRAVIVILSTTLMVAGVTIGWFGNQLLSEPAVVTTEVKVEELEAEFSEEELARLCSGNVKEHKEGILDLQGKVKGLQTTLLEKEKELDTLRTEAKKEKSPQTSKRQQELESELATLRIQLAATEQERDTLRTELKQTLTKLDSQIRETKKYKSKAKKYKRKSVENLWKAFVADAKVQGCDRGSRKRHEKCWAEFNSVLTVESIHQQRFMTCVNTYQAVPVLRKAKLFEKLPSFASWLSGEKNKGKYIKGWYIMFCDPSLPTNTEDPELDDEKPAPTKANKKWSDINLDE
jgi:hypothetical protein